MGPAFETFAGWYGVYGYPVLFLGVLLESAGIPVPGEAATLVAGFLASPAGGARFRLGWVIALAFTAAVLGDNVGFWLGRRLARPRLRRHQGFLLLTPQAMRRAEDYFERYGTWTVLLGRFVTGLRVVVALAAGTAGMPWSRFFPANAAGALAWASAVGLLGYFFGRSWQVLHHWLSWGSWIMLGAASLAAVLLYLWGSWGRGRTSPDGGQSSSEVDNMKPPSMAERLPAAGADWLLPAVLSTTAGAVDVIGFLALGGLFTAHITGNVVIVAAHYVTGGFSEAGPLLAVPVFVAVLGVVTVASAAVAKAGYGPRRGLLVLQAALLASCLGLGVAFGPLADADRAMAVLVGMLAVAAMATQNALVKLTLPGVPSTAVMTTNITQLTVDLATLARGLGKPDDLARAWHRVRVTFPCVVGFVIGCAAGAALEVFFGLWALMLPVILAALAVTLCKAWSDGRDVAQDGKWSDTGRQANARTATSV